MALKRITDLAAAGSLVGDEYLEVAQVSTTVKETATTISAQASDNSYNDSGSGFVTAGFQTGDRVRVTGFTNSGNNLVVGVVTAVTAAKLTIGGTDGDGIVDESAGNSVTIVKWGSRRALLDDIGIGAGGGGGGNLSIGFRLQHHASTDTTAIDTTSIYFPTWSVEAFDLGEFHASTNNYVTIPETGYYIFGGYIDMDDITAGGYVNVVLDIDGTQYELSGDEENQTSRVRQSPQFGLHYLTAGQVVKLGLIGNDASATLKNNSTFWGAKIGSGTAAAIRTETGTTYTLAATDEIVDMNNASANTITIPLNSSVPIAVGKIFQTTQVGAGATTIDAATGVTLNGVSGGSCTINAQWDAVSYYKRATDAWVVSGAHGGVS